MPAGALALLLVAALGHATWNYLAKGARNNAAFTFAFISVSLVVYAPVAVAAWLIQRPGLGADAVAFMAVSAVVHTTYYYVLTTGYRFGDLSLVYPLARGTGPAIAVAGGILLFDEHPSTAALAGAGLVIAGIIVMTWSREIRDGHRDVRLSVLFALLTGAIIGTYTLLDNKGVSLSTPIIYAYGINVFRLAILAPAVLLRPAGREALARSWQGERRAVLGIGVLEMGAYVLVLAALTLAPVSYVAPAREVSILIGALMGARLLGERDAPRRLAGAVAILAGIFALALG